MEFNPIQEIIDEATRLFGENFEEPDCSGCSSVCDYSTCLHCVIRANEKVVEE